MITIIDYKVGNLKSIQNILKRIGYDSIIASDVDQIHSGTKFILPGVGSFEYGMEKLKSMNYFDLLEKKILIEKRPILGVCLGLQLFFEKSEEGGCIDGLGWLKGSVVKFDEESMNPLSKIPHMGWNYIVPQKESKILEGLDSSSRFYFVHSYHIQCEDHKDELMKTNNGYSFVSGVEKDNIIGVQFHPEKSHKFGKTLYKNFICNY